VDERWLELAVDGVPTFFWRLLWRLPTVSCVVTPRCRVHRYRRIRGKYCLHLQGGKTFGFCCHSSSHWCCLKFLYRPLDAATATRTTCSFVFLSRSVRDAGHAFFSHNNANNTTLAHTNQGSTHHQWRIWYCVISCYKVRSISISWQWTSLCIWYYSPFLHFGRLFSFLILYTGGRTPWAGYSPSEGRYLHTQQHKHRKNAPKHPWLKWYLNPRSYCLSLRREFMPQSVRPLWSADYGRRWIKTN
jgi:hypothetical protein